MEYPQPLSVKCDDYAYSENCIIPVNASCIKADGINMLLTQAGIVQLRQTLDRKDPGFGWATFEWVSSNTDTFVPLA